MADVAGEGEPSQDLQFNGDFDSARLVDRWITVRRLQGS